MSKINYKRLNFQTSEQVDKMFREQALAKGMTMSEYFKYLVVAQDNATQFWKAVQEKMPNMTNLIEPKE